MQSCFVHYTANEYAINIILVVFFSIAHIGTDSIGKKVETQGICALYLSLYTAFFIKTSFLTFSLLIILLDFCNLLPSLSLC